MDAIKKTGVCVILAGAGTGKTYTIVEKVKHLVSNNVYPGNKIVCITFSNEAANNLSLRIEKTLSLSGIKKSGVVIRTFHGFSADLLRKYGDRIAISKEFKILDPEQAMVILHRNLKIQAGNCDKYISTIGTAKDLGVRLEDFQLYLENKLKQYPSDLEKNLESLSFEFQTLHLKKDFSKKKPLAEKIKSIRKIIELKKFVNAWNAYEKLKQKSNYQDYSDLNQNALILLQEFPEIAKDFDYVIVDEFQDTNKLQLDFLVKLAPEKNITIVGDINQSIYRFRGAYKENLNLFKRAFEVKDSDIFTLDKSFRSSNKILKAAHKLILNNYEKKEECFFVDNAHDREGPELKVIKLKNAKEEARKVVEIIKSSMEHGTPMEDICVMFRAHQYSRIIKRELEKSEIPYFSVSKSSLLKQKSVRIIVDYLKILSKLKKKEPGAEEAWWNLIYNLDFSQQDLITLGKEIKRLSKRKDKPAEGKETMMNLDKLFEISKVHEELYDSDLANFLYYLEVLESLGIEIEAAKLEEKGIRLMTSHSTKGLEYNTVIISNFTQGRFPIERYSGNPLIPTELLPEVKEEISGLGEEERDNFIQDYEKHNQILEERRLCYVSFTRAKENLFVTFADEYNEKKFSPSQFLEEISYKSNPDIQFQVDNEEKFIELNSEQKMDHLKALSQDNFETALSLLSKEDKKEKEQKSFSPSSLLLFDKCEKEFEYKYLYNMPERKTTSWEAMKLGSFVHLIFEKGVKQNFRSQDDFLHLAKELSMEEEWESLNLEEAETLIKVFFERNKNKYNEKSKTEEYLPLSLSGIHFMGFADRIDFKEDGAVEIIDYKTGKSQIAPKDRNWQLGFYALAAKAKYGKVKKVILDMLKQEKPIEFEITKDGDAVCTSSKFIPGFNINEVEKELIDTATRIQNAYKTGFKPCPIEKNCEFCNEYVYNL